MYTFLGLSACKKHGAGLSLLPSSSGRSSICFSCFAYTFTSKRGIGAARLRESGCKFVTACPLWEGRAHFFTNPCLQISKTVYERSREVPISSLSAEKRKPHFPYLAFELEELKAYVSGQFKYAQLLVINGTG